jgi:DNA-binding NarL/FixJ family response regulator
MTPTLTPAPADQRFARVMLVDDHPSFRATARWLLESEGYQVVAEAASGETALDLAVAAAPDLVLLDIGLPGIDGFQVCSAIRARLPRARIVLISSRDLRDVGRDRVLACGADGFVHKADLSDAALAAIVAPGTSPELR